MEQRNKHLFSKVLVAYCLAVCTVVSLWAMYIAARDNFLCTGVLGAVLGVFGGELLLLCVKRIMCGDRDAKRNVQPDCDPAEGRQSY